MLMLVVEYGLAHRQHGDMLDWESQPRQSWQMDKEDSRHRAVAKIAFESG